MKTLTPLLLLICLTLSAISLVISLNHEPASSAEFDSRELENRIARLEESLAGLRAAEETTEHTKRAEEARERGPDGLTRQPSMETRVRALEAIVEPWADHPGSGPEGGVSVRELERTREALDMIQREEVEAQVARWVKREQERAAEFASAVASRLDLSDGERLELERIFGEESEAQAVMMEDLWSEEKPANADEERHLSDRWDDATVRMRELREQRDRQLRDLLGTDRYKELKDLDPKKKRRKS